MRIGIDARIVYYARGGIRNYVLHLLDALPPLDADTDYYVLHSRKDQAPPLPGTNLRPVPCWTPSHHRLERWALGVEVARLGLDLLHSTDFIPPALGPRRSVITVHDLNFLHYPQFLTAESHRYYNQQIAWAVRRADHILADSHATKSDLVSLLDVPLEKVTVVHLAADPAFRPLAEADVRRVAAQYGLEPGYLLFERVEVLHLQGRVRFLHDVPDADLPAMYNAASVLATPSFYEGFGLPALEAMACGTPVVVADRASLPEVVGEAGLLVNPDDPDGIARALARVLTDEPLRARMQELGLAQAGRFTWERAARATLAVYREVMGR
jgi:hypothetical protein